LGCPAFKGIHHQSLYAEQQQKALEKEDSLKELEENIQKLKKP